MEQGNLIPAERTARKRRKARRRMWTALCATYAVLLAVGSLAAHMICPSEARSAIEQLEGTALEIEQSHHTLLALRDELAQAAATLEAARAMRQQPQWSHLFAELSRRLGQEMVLSRCQLVTSMASGRSDGNEWKESLASKPLGAFLTERRYRLALSGFGKTQESVSQFVLKLEGVGVFERVRLVNSSRQTFQDGEAVAFSVDCHF